MIFDIHHSVIRSGSGSFNMPDPVGTRCGPVSRHGNVYCVCLPCSAVLYPDLAPTYVNDLLSADSLSSPSTFHSVTLLFTQK